MDNFSSGSWDNLDSVREESRLEVVEGDVRRAADTQAAMEGAAGSFIWRPWYRAVSVEEPLQSFTNNVQGTFNLFEAARLGGVGRVVYASSAAVYDDNPNTPLREDVAEPSVESLCIR